MLFTLPPDPYQALGVARDAQIPEIRSAHRKLILKCHPDKVQDPQLKAEKQSEFQRVQQAYELLSDEIARAKYDEKYRYNEKFGELEKEKEKAKMSTSPPSARTFSRKAAFEPEIRTAEPRPSTFAKTGTSPSANKFYTAGYTSSRSWEDELGGSGSRPFDDPRRTKKSPGYSTSYERAEREREREREREQRDRDREREEEWREREKARRDEDRRKRKEEELAREQRVKQEAKAAKEAQRDADEKKKKERRDKDKDKKKAEKERKRDAEDKHRRHKQPYAEHYHEDTDQDDAIPHGPAPERRSSSSRKMEEPVKTDQPMATDREMKTMNDLQKAIWYLERSGSHAATGRSPTYAENNTFRHVQAPPAAAPTPPPATNAMHPPPPPPQQPMARDVEEEEDTARRSSGRSSRTKPPDSLRTKDKSRRSNSRSASKEGPRIVEVGRTPSDRSPPKLNKSHSDPPKIVRSYTDGYARPTMPTLDRQHTWQGEERLDRGRSRHMHSWDEEEVEEEVLPRRSRRTQSPEVMATPGTTLRYAVADGKARRKYAEPVPIPTPRSSRKTKHSAAANISSPRADPSAGMYYQEDYADMHAPFDNIKFSNVVDADQVAYSNLPRHSSSYGKEYATPAY